MHDRYNVGLHVLNCDATILSETDCPTLKGEKGVLPLLSSLIVIIIIIIIIIIIVTSSGLFDATEDNLKISICPQHRELYGIRWRCNKKKCSTPVDWAPHKSKKVKGDRGLTSLQSKGIFQLTNQLVHVGTRKLVLILH